MPCKDDVCVVDDHRKSPQKEIFRPECVEELVAAIKHNLQLKARPCHVLHGKQRRSSPYSVPVRSVSKPKSCDNTASPLKCSEFSYRTCAKTKSSHSTYNTASPYDLLQELLRNGNLIKEAVSRLACEPNKKTNFYDSESDEAYRSPLVIDL